MHTSSFHTQIPELPLLLSCQVKRLPASARTENTVSQSSVPEHSSKTASRLLTTESKFNFIHIFKQQLCPLL